MHVADVILHGEDYSCTLAEWLAANAYLDPADLAAVLALEPGESHTGGGGAAEAWTVTRQPDPNALLHEWACAVLSENRARANAAHAELKLLRRERDMLLICRYAGRYGRTEPRLPGEAEAEARANHRCRRMSVADRHQILSSLVARGLVTAVVPARLTELGVWALRSDDIHKGKRKS